MQLSKMIISITSGKKKMLLPFLSVLGNFSYFNLKVALFGFPLKSFESIIHNNVPSQLDWPSP